MLKVFLIDDEIEVREGIRNNISWSDAGFEYTGDAPDGEIALPMIEKLKPDILITDIRMPFMDGLQVSRIIRQKMPHIKIIILSGHDEFEYAREALRINVTEYCLKPTSSVDLLKTLHHVAQKIDDEKQVKKYLEDLEFKVIQSLSLTQDELLNELCLGKISTTDAVEKAADINLEITAKYYFVMIIDTDHMNTSLIKLVEEISPCYCFMKSLKEKVFIFKGDLLKELEELATLLIEKLLLEIENNRDIRCIFGMGGIKERLIGIHHSFVEANEEKNYQSMLCDESYELQPFDRNELIIFFKYGEKNNMSVFIDSYTSCLKTSNLRASFLVYYFLMDVTMTAAKFVKELETLHEDVIQAIYHLEKKISRIHDMERIKYYIEEILNLIIDLRNRSNNKFDTIISKAKDYIQSHFNEQEISLNVVASYVNVSASYFSNIFSQETGQTFVEFLTMTRMNKAMELLKTTHDKTYEIAYKVGYNDPHYFCHLFKKATGMTTKDFRAAGKVTI